MIVGVGVGADDTNGSCPGGNCLVKYTNTKTITFHRVKYKTKFGPIWTTFS